MHPCEAAPITWKGRRAFRLANGLIEVTVLIGGGHIADFRLCNSPYNLVFESPWPTIEPSQFDPRLHAKQYGDGPVGRMLCGYTGHALALGYFGMPNAEEAKKGLPLHGEVVDAEWNVVASGVTDTQASFTLEAHLPVYGLRVKRTLSLSADASSVLIEERVTNLNSSSVDFQWVEHAAFGEPFFSEGESQLYLSADRGRSWPLGYEGHEVLAADRDFTWPLAPTMDGDELDLSLPFQREGTGFVAALLTYTQRSDAFIAVHNRRLQLAVGYVFDRQRFPWIALWEENRARQYAPWKGITRARGVEFGTSPMPLGLEQAREMKKLYDVPVFATIRPGETISTAYQLFATSVPHDWPLISNVLQSTATLTLLSGNGQTIVIPATPKK